MTPFIQRSPLGQGARGPLAQWNGIHSPTDIEQWHLDIADLVLSPMGTLGTPLDFAAQDPATAVAAVNALAWSDIARWGNVAQTTYYNGTPYAPGFPTDGWPDDTSPTWPGPLVSGTYRVPFAGQQQVWPAGGLGIASAPLALTMLSGSSYLSDGPYPGASSLYGASSLLSYPASLWVFNARAYAGPQWVNAQMASRTRYRLRYPQGMCGIRLLAELHAQHGGTYAGPWTDGASLTDWNGNSGAVVQVAARNFTWQGFVMPPNHTTSDRSDTTSDWTEIPMPPIPAAWDAQASAVAGLVGYAMMDFWGYATRSQWQAVTGQQIT